jgi:hypothetical protein
MHGLDMPLRMDSDRACKGFPGDGLATGSWKAERGHYYSIERRRAISACSKVM